MVNIARLLQIAAQLELLRMRLKSTETPEDRAALIVLIAELVNEFSTLTDGAQVTPEDVARDVESHERNQG